MPDDAVAPGGAMLFGKLPRHGDFVARGIEAGVRETLDTWLSASLAQARLALGARFEEHFDTAPPWRFAERDSAGSWCAGAIAPSVDAVGRRFPLLVARGLEGAAVDEVAAACENAIYDAFGGGWDADRLHAGLLAIAADASADGADVRDGWWTEGNAGYAPARLDGRRPAGLIAAMLRGEGDSA